MKNEEVIWQSWIMCETSHRLGLYNVLSIIGLVSFVLACCANCLSVLHELAVICLVREESIRLCSRALGAYFDFITLAVFIARRTVSNSFLDDQSVPLLEICLCKSEESLYCKI